MEKLSRRAGNQAANGTVILAHLGNGTSLAAVRHGKPTVPIRKRHPSPDVGVDRRIRILEIFYIFLTVRIHRPP
jgi:hypothetical protein